MVVECPDQQSGLGWLGDGTLLVVSMKTQRVLRLSDGSLATHADFAGSARGVTNDMIGKVGRHGLRRRHWASTSFELESRLRAGGPDLPGPAGRLDWSSVAWDGAYAGPTG